MKHVIDLFWNIVIVALTVVACYLGYTRGYFDRFLARPPEPAVATAPVPASNAPTGAVAPPANANASTVPAAQAVLPTPTATATPEVAPTPEPPINLATLDARSLPVQVKLCRATVLPIVANGKQIGSTTSPAGMMLRLVGVRDGQLEVQVGEATQLIPADATDVIERVRTLRHYTGNAANTPRPTSNSVPPWETPQR